MNRLVLNFAAALFAASACGTAASAAPPAYTISRTIPLGAPDRWDYVTYDAASNHVLVAHGTHTDIVDASSGQVLGKLDGLHGAHGQAVAPDGNIYADSGETGTITAFDMHTMKAGRTSQAGLDADGVILEPRNRLVVVLDGDGQSATLIDTTGKQLPVTVKLGGEPEFAAAPGDGSIFVNIASTGEIVRIDAARAKVTARYALPGCVSPHGLAMDPRTQRLFATCLNSKLLVVDAATGKTLQVLPIGKGTDAAAFDATRRLVFSSNGEGTLSVLQEDATGHLAPLADIKTAQGARTLAVDPQSGRVFLVTADVTGSRPAGHGGLVPRFDFKPGTVKLLFLDPVQPGQPG